MKPEQAHKPELIRDLMAAVLADIGRTQQSAQQILLSRWQDIVSPQAALFCAPQKINHTTLFVTVTNSSWMFELTTRKQAIIAAVHSVPGMESIGDIRFMIGEIGI